MEVFNISGHLQLWFVWVEHKKIRHLVAAAEHTEKKRLKNNTFAPGCLATRSLKDM